MVDDTDQQPSIGPDDKAIAESDAVEPDVLGQAANYVRDQFQQGGRNIHEALTGANRGDYNKLNEMTMGMALSSMAPSKGLLEAPDFHSVRDVAHSYMQDKGLPIEPFQKAPVSPARGAAIASEYENMAHAPDDPVVKKAYQALIDETLDQFQKVKATGLKMEKIQPGESNPYPRGSSDLFDDINGSNHIYYYPTEQGFGNKTGAASDHPMLQLTDEIGPDGKPMPANDVFRIVHDYFGHAKEQVGFGPQGEENAWRVHKQMYSPEAQKAMTTETRGQNSWVNYGPHGAENRANPANTVYADQKAGLLPEWTTVDEPESNYLVHYSARAGDVPEINPKDMGAGNQGREGRRGDIIPRNYYYEGGTRPEDTVVSNAKSVRYVKKPNKILDLASDDAAPFINQYADANEMEKAIAGAGYDGYKNSAHPNLPNVVALFTPQKVVHSTPIAPGYFDAITNMNVSPKAPTSFLESPAVSAGAAGGAGAVAREAIQSAGEKVLEDQSDDKKRSYADGGFVAQQPADAVSPPPPQPGGPVNVVNPEGNLVSIPAEQLADALSAGYQQATPEHVQNYMDLQQYGTLPQQALTAVEGAGEMASFGLTGALEGPGSLKRREINPGAHMVGQGIGLIGSSMLLPGGGAAGAIGRAGAAGAKALGLGAAESMAGKIGGAAVKGAIDNALVQGQDEVAKMLAKDPNQSAQTALLNMGLAATIGGSLSAGIGAINPLWKATAGKKLGAMLQSFTNKAGGVEGLPEDLLNDAIELSGVAVSPEVKSALGNNPNLRHIWQTLQESGTGSGLQAQEAYKQFKGQLGDAILNSLGKTPEDVDALSAMSDNDAGTAVKNALRSSLKERIEPISNEYEKLQDKFKDVPIPGNTMYQLAMDISRVGDETGATLSPSSSQAKEVQRILGELSNIKTLENLRRYGSIVGDNTQNPDMWRIGSQLKKVFRTAEESTLETHFGDTMNQDLLGTSPEEGQALAQRHTAARAAYRTAMDTIDSLNDRLHVGSYKGPDSFISKLGEMSPEDVIRRLSPKGDAGIIGELAGKFPEVADLVRNYHLDQTLKAASMKSLPGETLNIKTLFNLLDKMSPEMRQFVLPEGSQPTMSAVKDLINALPSKMNNSGTAKTLDSLMSHLPSSAVALFSFLQGHGPVTSAIFGGITRALGRDIPDAARLATLKWLGEAKPLDTEGFKAMADYMHNVIQGEAMLNRSVKSVFKAGTEVLPQAYMPSPARIQQLEKALKVAQTGTGSNEINNLDGKVGHYMPDHNAAIAQTASRAIAVLNSSQPATKQPLPLDRPVKPSAFQVAEQQAKLAIAQQPLVVMDKIKRGTLTPADVVTFRSIYPDLHARMVQKLSDAVIETMNKGGTVPYNTRLSLSLFMGQPLDSTMTPAAIALAQPQAGQAPGAQSAGSPAKRSTASLSKLPSSFQTTAQAAESRRANH